MSELRDRLLSEFGNETYRKEYSEQYVNSLLAAQIGTIREQRGLSQSALAEKIDKQQPAISRIENVNYARWNVRTLREIASALDCWLDIRLQSWGKLVSEADAFSAESLRRERYEDDPVIFGSEAQNPVTEPVRWMQKKLLPWLRSESEDSDQLVRWLQSLDLPPVGDEEPSFLWIVRAIEAEPAEAGYRNLLVEKVVALLSQAESGRGLTDEVFSGAFALLANFPSQQGWELLKKWNADPTHSKDLLPQGCLPAFLSALIRNQRDASLEDEWIDTIDKGSHPWLPAVELDGFEGLKGIPASPVNGVTIRMDLLSEGLRKLSVAKQRRPDSFIDLTMVMEGLKNSFQSRFLAEMLLRSGLANHWRTDVVDAWAEVFTSDPEEIRELLARVAPKERNLICSVVSAHQTALRAIAPEAAHVITASLTGV
jgi:transcriptional regulator with XRE-family HTH domain